MNDSIDDLKKEIALLKRDVLTHYEKNNELLNRLNESQSLSQVGSWTWNLQTSKVEWSDTMFHLLGLSPEHDIPSYELALHHIHESDKALYEKTLSASLEDKSMYFLENKITKLDKSVRSVISRGAFIKESDGTISRMIGTIQDVTEENLLLDSNMRLSDFAHIISHDIKGPLGVLKGFITLLKESETAIFSEKELKILDLMESSTNELGDLTSYLLSQSHLHSPIINPIPFLIRPLIDEECFYVKNGQSINSVQISISDFPEYVVADRFKLKQIFRNLLSNAPKFSKPNVPLKIEISYEHREDFHVIKVSDNGIGIEAKHIDSIFEAYKQINYSQKDKSSGLGLHICRQMASDHGGEIWAESVFNSGSTFTFTIPTILSPA